MYAFFYFKTTLIVFLDSAHRICTPPIEVAGPAHNFCLTQYNFHLYSFFQSII